MITIIKKEVKSMKKIYKTPSIQEISAEEFYNMLTNDNNAKGSCYSCKGCK